MKRTVQRDCADQETFVFEFEELPVEPSVTFHKSGRFARLKANDPRSADVLAEVLERLQDPKQRDLNYYDYEVPENKFKVGEGNSCKLEIWRLLGSELSEHPLSKILATYGLKVHVAPALKNYMAREYRRQLLEGTPFPVAEIKTEVPLFERCAEFTILRCVKNFVAPGDTVPTFKKGNRYLVLSVGDEGRDVVVLGTKEVVEGAILDKAAVAGRAVRFEWTAANGPMESYFDDSEEFEVGKTLLDLYAGRVKQMQTRMEKLGFPIYKHSRVDAPMEALKRGVLNAKRMRMGKSREALVVTQLWGSKKIGISSPRNARIFWEREFKRCNITDYVLVDSLEDLEKPGRYYLMPDSWLKRSEDPNAKPRADWKGYLKPSFYWGRRRIVNEINGVQYPTKKFEKYKISQFNDCPHCGQPMERPVLGKDPLTGKFRIIEWSKARGYICRSKDCKWTTDNRSSVKLGEKPVRNGKSHTGAAWSRELNGARVRKLVTHAPGSYIDITLAGHANCEDDHLRGRMCPTCRATDGVWTPGIYKRVKKMFTSFIADEIHNSNRVHGSTQIAQAILNMRAKRRIGLTGTPQANSAADIYWTLAWLLRAPNRNFPYFGPEGRREFVARFCSFLYFERGTGTYNEETGEEIVKTVKKQIPFLRNPADFWRFMADKVVRRTYDDPLYQESLLDAGLKMATLEPWKIPCPMAPKQTKLMLSCIKQFRDRYEEMQKEAEKKKRSLNEALVIRTMGNMKIAATVPEMLNDKFKVRVYDGPDLGGKRANLVDHVEKELQRGGKVLLLGFYQKAIESAAKELERFKPLVFKTNWSEDEKKEAFLRFSDDPECRLFCATTMSLAEGTDLSPATAIISLDVMWSPTKQLQAWSRALTPTSEERVVKAWILLSENSIDEHIFETFYAKDLASMQAYDHKMVSRRVQTFDVKQFVAQLLETEESLTRAAREVDVDEFFIPDLPSSAFEERAV